MQTLLFSCLPVFLYVCTFVRLICQLFRSLFLYIPLNNYLPLHFLLFTLQTAAMIHFLTNNKNSLFSGSTTKAFPPPP